VPVHAHRVGPAHSNRSQGVRVMLSLRRAVHGSDEADHALRPATVGKSYGIRETVGIVGRLTAQHLERQLTAWGVDMSRRPGGTQALTRPAEAATGAGEGVHRLGGPPGGPCPERELAQRRATWTLQHDIRRELRSGRYNSRAHVLRFICYQVGCVTCGCPRKAGGDRVAVAAWRPLWRERLLSGGQVTSRTRRGRPGRHMDRQTLMSTPSVLVSSA
jgi:hypothetical protein